MSRKPLIAGNWKMNATHLEAIQMVQKLSYRLESDDYERVDVVVAPPFTALRSVQTVVEADRLAIQIGAQNCDFNPSGAFTGEISVEMLAKLSVSYVIVGHSERRGIFGETDDLVAKKAKAVLDGGMTPIVCVGETGEQRAGGHTEEVVSTQVSGSLRGIDPASVVIAYEPVWAIGTGQTATADDAAEVITAIRAQLESAGEGVRILYGGSVNAGNIAGFMAKRDIDGALVGGASLDPDSFASIVRYWM